MLYRQAPGDLRQRSKDLLYHAYVLYILPYLQEAQISIYGLTQFCAHLLGFWWQSYRLLMDDKEPILEASLSQQATGLMGGKALSLT